MAFRLDLVTGEWQEPETSEAEAFAYGGTAARYRREGSTTGCALASLSVSSFKLPFNLGIHPTILGAITIF